MSIPRPADNQVMLTARFIVGVESETAILRIHDKLRANIGPHPGWHSRTLGGWTRHQ